MKNSIYRRRISLVQATYCHRRPSYVAMNRNINEITPHWNMKRLDNYMLNHVLYVSIKFVSIYKCVVELLLESFTTNSNSKINHITNW